MKVKELIKTLQNYNENLEIIIMNEDEINGRPENFLCEIINITSTSGIRFRDDNDQPRLKSSNSDTAEKIVLIETTRDF